MVELTDKKYSKKKMLIMSGKNCAKNYQLRPNKWGEINRKYLQALKGVGI